MTASPSPSSEDAPSTTPCRTTSRCVPCLSPLLPIALTRFGGSSTDPLALGSLAPAALWPRRRRQRPLAVARPGRPRGRPQGGRVRGRGRPCPARGRGWPAQDVWTRCVSGLGPSLAQPFLVPVPDALPPLPPRQAAPATSATAARARARAALPPPVTVPSPAASSPAAADTGASDPFPPARLSADQLTSSPALPDAPQQQPVPPGRPRGDGPPARARRGGRPGPPGVREPQRRQRRPLDRSRCVPFPSSPSDPAD